MTLENALKKLEGAHSSIRNAAINFVKHAFSLGMTFTISEVLRTYERQCLLLSQGRTRNDIMKNVFPYGFKLSNDQMKDMMRIYDEGREMKGENRVTFTLSSQHLSGTAMDVYPINTTYTELSALALKWNIKQPWLWDQPHFDLTNARIPEPVTTISTMENLRGKNRRLERVKEDYLKNPTERQKELIETLSRMIDRLRNRIGV